jgi:ribonucleoside-diphosphate reductase alpha chain
MNDNIQPQIDILSSLIGDLSDIDLDLIKQEIELEVVENSTSIEVDEAVLKVLVQNIPFEFAYSYLAARYLFKTLESSVFGDFSTSLHEAAREGKFSNQVLSKFDLNELQDYLKHNRDNLFDYQGAVIFKTRYRLKSDALNKYYETPQGFWMRIAMSLAVSESNPTQKAKEFYDVLSTLQYTPAGSTLRAAGIDNGQMANCFLSQVEDSIEDIYHQDYNLAQLSKFNGGIGTSITKLRARGSVVDSIDIASCGAVEWAQHFDHTLSKITRGHKRKPACTVYMEPWHLDFPDFIRARQSSVSEELRYKNYHTVCWVNDEFMRRVEAGDFWYLLDPKDFPELPDLYGKDFDSRYNEIVSGIESGNLVVRHQKVSAKDLYRDIIINLKETGHPWITFKDTSNVRSQMQNSGVIHNSNLCTEIVLPNSKDEVAVCIIGSVNLVRHLKPDLEIQSTDTAADVLDIETFKHSIRTGMRMLDNVVEENWYPIPEAKKASTRNRSVGLGISGLSDFFCALNLAFDSKEALKLWEEICYIYSSTAYEASADLAKERGNYEMFDGSNWSKGVLPIDTYIDGNYDQMKVSDTEYTPFIPNEDELSKLRAKVKSGMRNSVCTAIAPTEHIAKLTGVSNSIEPIFANIFTHKAVTKGKTINVNRFFIKKLGETGLWDTFKDDILEVFGDVEALDFISDDIRNVYRNAFQIPVEAQINIAGVAQKYMDQTLSRNLYHSETETEKAMQKYLYAWKVGLKTTYYAIFRPTKEYVSKFSYETDTAVDTIKSTTVKDSTIPSSDTKGMSKQEVEMCSLENKDECEACQ